MSYKSLLAGSLMALNGCGSQPPAPHQPTPVYPKISAKKNDVIQNHDEVRFKKAKQKGDELLAQMEAMQDSRAFNHCFLEATQKIQSLFHKWQEKTADSFEDCSGKPHMKELTQCQADILVEKEEFTFLADNYEQTNAVISGVLECTQKLLPLSKSKVDYSSVSAEKPVKKTPGNLEQESTVIHLSIVELLESLDHKTSSYVEGLCRYDDPEVAACNKIASDIYKKYRDKYTKEIAYCNQNPPPNFEHTEGACGTYVMKKKVTPYVEYKTQEITCKKMTKVCVESKKKQIAGQ